MYYPPINESRVSKLSRKPNQKTHSKNHQEKITDFEKSRRNTRTQNISLRKPQKNTNSEMWFKKNAVLRNNIFLKMEKKTPTQTPS